MNKSGLISILGVAFVIASLLYSATSSGITGFLHLILLLLGSSISILMIDHITKSSNPLRSKIYFSFITPAVLFSSIVFFWFLGDHSGLDYMGLGTVAVIVFSVLFWAISLVTGTVLSLKRRTRGDFAYDLRSFFYVSTVIFVLLLVLSSYNPVVFAVAGSTNTKGLCRALISPDIRSYMFNEALEQDCLERISIGLSKTGPVDCTGIEDSKQCYIESAINKKDVKICVNNVAAETEWLRYGACQAAIMGLHEEIHAILRDPRHPDILYAIKSIPFLGGYYDESVVVPLLKDIVVQGNLDAKKEALDSLFALASYDSKVLQEDILPLIRDQPDLQEYVDEINERAHAVSRQGLPSNISTR